MLFFILFGMYALPVTYPMTVADPEICLVGGGGGR